jgi:hypothetical protein
MELDATLYLTLRAAFALLFASAVLHKLRAPREFAVILAGYLRGTVLGGGRFDRVLVPAVIGLELLAVLFCLWPTAGAAAAGLVAGLLLVYAAGIARILGAGLALPDCGCGWGGARQPPHVFLVLRNLLLAALAVVMVLPVQFRPLGLIDIVSVSVATLTLMLLYMASASLLAVASDQGSAAR